MKRILLAVLMFAGIASAQVTTTITGTFRDGSGALITSGQVAFFLQPGIDTTMSGVARFSPTEVDCAISGSGTLSGCTLNQNTAITSPSGTSWKACIQPQFIQPGSCFVFYAIGTTLDISTTPATPPLTPAYSLVDTFSNQTIAGNKTFNGTVTFGGTLNLGAITLGGAFTDLFGGTLGGTFAGSPTFSGNPTFSGTPVFSNPLTAASLISPSANPATSGIERLATGDTACWRNAANGANVCLSDAGAGSSATGGFADNLKWNGGAIQAAAFVGGGTAIAGSGVLNTANNVCAVAAENSLSNGDICAVKVNGSNVTALGGSGGVSINGGAALTGQTGSGASVVTNTGPTISSPVISVGIASTSTGVQMKRTTTGSLAQNVRTDVTMTWPTAFADTNYTVTCILLDTSASGLGARTERLRSQAAGNVVVQVVNDNAVAVTATVQCIAIHD